jgi:hypothetical protein
LDEGGIDGHARSSPDGHLNEAEHPLPACPKLPTGCGIT